MNKIIMIVLAFICINAFGQETSGCGGYVHYNVFQGQDKLTLNQQSLSSYIIHVDNLDSIKFVGFATNCYMQCLDYFYFEGVADTNYQCFSNGQDFEVEFKPQYGKYRFVGIQGDYDHDDEIVIRSSAYTGIDRGDLNARTKVYPNPFTDFIEISFSEESQIRKVTVLNALGEEIFRNDLTSNDPLVLNLENQQAGLYFIRCTYDEGVVVRRVVKK